MNYYSTIKALYPDILDSEFDLRNNAGVVTIPVWTYSGAAKPTVGYLDSQAALGDLLFAKTQKRLELSASCAAVITAGFTSSALGSPHNYPSKENPSNGEFDQTNLGNAATVANMSGLSLDWTSPLWAEDGDNVWAFVAHTASQVKQVMSDFLTASNESRSTLSELMELVADADTVEEVAAIEW
jgi:hypothetical protein